MHKILIRREPILQQHGRSHEVSPIHGHPSRFASDAHTVLLLEEICFASNQRHLVAHGHQHTGPCGIFSIGIPFL